MASCRVLVNCIFKKGMEEKGTKALENMSELLLKRGCVGVEIFQEADNPSHCYYAADWNSLEDAKRCQDEWEQKAGELRNCCTNAPKREFYTSKRAQTGKARKAA